MRMKGRLFVFEGPDGVGKSELSLRFTERLARAGVSCEHLAFPGHSEATLGKLVHGIHHDSARFGIERMTATSLQLLHVAAHVDAIESRILPALLSGRSIVLDRYWWSTLVYGTAAGVPLDILRALIRAERAVWKKVTPTAAYLICRTLPLHLQADAEWQRLKELYNDLAGDESRHYPVVRVDNDATVEHALEQVSAPLQHKARKRRDLFAQLPLWSTGAEIKKQTPLTWAPREKPRPSAVFDTYWRFAVERQSIFFKRLSGMRPPWTVNPILLAHKFTNAYRASDRVSQYLIRHVIYEGNQSAEELFFRILLFKIFNKIETWQLLETSLGSISFANDPFDNIDTILSRTLAVGRSIYSAAYIMPSGGGSRGCIRKHQSHLQLLTQMMSDKLYLRIANARSMAEAFRLLKAYPMIGDFLAYQYITDINYSPLTDFSETEFVIPGPGAKSGIQKCFSSRGELSDVDLIRFVMDDQDNQFSRLGLAFQDLWGRPLQLIDCQNLFCEVNKYARIKHPDVRGVGQRTRIKQRFVWNPSQICYWYPPKWGLNQRIYEDDARSLAAPGPDYA